MRRVKTSITLDIEKKHWLDAHPEIVTSDLVNDVIESMMDSPKELDEQKLEREAEYLRSEIRNNRQDLASVEAQLSRLRAERQKAQEEEAERLEFVDRTLRAAAIERKVDL